MSVNGVMQRITQILNNLPPGILQPFIVKFDVSNIPVAFRDGLRRATSTNGRSTTWPTTPSPRRPNNRQRRRRHSRGRKIRQININLDPALLQGAASHPRRGPRRVKASNLILPSGDIKAGNLDYNVFTNTQFKTVEPISDVVVKIDARGNPVRVRDVGVLTDSSDIQTNVVRTDGKRSVYLRVNKADRQHGRGCRRLTEGHPKMIGIPRRAVGDFLRSVDLHPAINQEPHRAGTARIAARGGGDPPVLRNLTSTLIISVAIRCRFW